MNFISISFCKRLIKKIWLNLELLNTLLKENFPEDYELLQHFFCYEHDFVHCSKLYSILIVPTAAARHQYKNIKCFNGVKRWGETRRFPKYLQMWQFYHKNFHGIRVLFTKIKKGKVGIWVCLTSFHPSLVGSHVTGLVYWRSPDRIHQ